MTVSSDIKRKDYDGDGVSTEFPTGFRFLQKSDLKVIQTDSDLIETILVLDSDYSVAGAGDESGTVTTFIAPESGETLTILRNIELTQDTDYVEGDDFPAETHENALDKLTMITQQLQEVQDRTVKLSEGQQSTGLEIPAPIEGKFLQWDDSGNLVNVDISSTDGIVVGVFGETLVANNTASDARDDLDVYSTSESDSLYATQSYVDDYVDNAVIITPDKYKWPTISVNSTDSDHDIDFSAGEKLDSTGAEIVALSAMTKQIDSAWSAGNASGGLFSGTVASDTTYYCFAIVKDSDGTVDAGFDIDKDCSNIPSGYSVYTRIGKFRTDGSSNIIAFTQYGDYFIFNSQILDASLSTVSTIRVTLDTSVPDNSIGIYAADLTQAGSRYVLFTSIDQDDTVPANDNNTLRVSSDSTICMVEFLMYADDSGRIRYRSSDASVSALRLYSHGWIDQRID